MMGMLKEGVRLDRVRGGRQKYRRNPNANPYQLPLFSSGSSMVPTSLDDIKILEVLALSEPDLLAIVQPNGGNSGASSDKEADDKSDMFLEVHEMLSVLSDIYDRELVSVIGWAKQIPGKVCLKTKKKEKKRNLEFNLALMHSLWLPGFIELPLNDQMKLLQMTWAELLTLQLAYRSIPFSGKLIFAKEFWLDERSAKACGALDLYNHVSLAQTSEPRD